MRLKRFTLPACLVPLLAACASPAWYYQATAGHLELMHSRQEVAEYLQEAGTDDPLAGRLELAGNILDFAQDEVGLPSGESYRSVVLTGRDAVVWNVVAAPEFSLEPKKYCFLVAGCVPYRGYFEEDKARKEAERLRRRDLDVAVSPARAYSSLGWFDDPLLDTMLSLPDAALAGILFHELAHQRLYVKGDTDFNEAYATFVESKAVRAWLIELNDPVALRDWEDRTRASRQFQSLLRVVRNSLQDVYVLDISDTEMRMRKQSQFDSLHRRHDDMVRLDWHGTPWFASWFEEPPNNARLALAGSYLGGQCAFDQLFRQADGDFEAFHLLAEGKSGLAAEQRAAWLAEPCPE